MVFSSLIFLWLFLPLAVFLNRVIKPRYSNAFLLFASLIFYAWGEPRLVFLMIVSILVNWGVGRGIEKYEAHKRSILTLGVLFNLALLGYYKYAGFGVQILNCLAGGEKNCCQFQI